MQKPSFGVYMLSWNSMIYILFSRGRGGGGRGPFIVVCYLKTEVNDAGPNQEWNYQIAYNSSYIKMSITISEINALINKNDWLDDQYSISFTLKWMIFKYRLCI